MSSIATILPGTPGPSCDSRALGGAQSQTKQIYDEVIQRRDDHGHYMARWFSKLNINVLHNGLVNIMMLNTEYQQSWLKETKQHVLEW